jgi:endo-1,4-beta-D-glucanase Y
MTRRLSILVLGALLLVSGPAWAVPLLYPNHKTAAQLQNDLQAVYAKWRADCITAAGTSGTGGYRVQRPNDKGLEINSTVSEGQGYGLIIAAYMGDQALFDGLWKYTAKWLDNNGLMNWYINAAGTGLGANPSGSGAAPDADEDVILGLILAHYKWGSAGATNYQALANAMIGKMYANEVDPADGKTLKVGDGWGGVGGPHNSSYFDPSSYKIFAQFSGNAAWNGVADQSYTIINLSINAANGNSNNGLVPAWHDTTGAPISPFAPSGVERPNWWTYYQYDACRTPFRLAKDYIFFGDSRAKAYLDKVNTFFPALGAANIKDGYKMDGTAAPEVPTLTVSQYAYSQSAPFIGPAGVAAMAGSDQQFVNDCWDQMASVATGGCLVGGVYYAESWAVLCMLMMNGQFTDPIPPPPTPTLTPTPNPCAVAYRINCGGGPAVGAFAADQQYTSGSYGYVTGTTDSPSTTTGTITVNGSSAPAQVYNTERWCYECPVSYQFDVPAGTYSVIFHWAETYYATAGNRSLAATINGVAKVPSFDLFTKAGGENIAYDVTVTGITPSNGHIIITITSSNNSATIAGLEVVGVLNCTPSMTPSSTPNWTATPTATVSRTPTVSPTRSASPTFSPSFTASPSSTPIPAPDACSSAYRVDCGSTTASYTDSLGAVWRADTQYAAGSYGCVTWSAGTATSSAGPITSTNDPTLYETERYGSTEQYRFDVAAGSYLVTIKLAETNFGTAGNRNETITINGVQELNQDLYTWCGGKNVARDLVVSGVSPVAGHIDIAFSSSNQNATVMGISVIGGTPCTGTVTPTIFGTLTSTSTITATPSASSSLTPSATPTPSATAEPSGTATPSFSATGTPSGSPTRTASASPSGSPTFSATAEPSGTATPSFSATGTRSATPTPSATAEPSGTISPTFTSVPPDSTVTDSPTLTATSSPSGSPTASATASPSASATGTVSVSPSVSATSSPTATASSSGTPTLTATFSPTASATCSASPTFINVPAGSTATGSPTLTATPSPSGTATPGNGVTQELPGPPQLLDARVVPNPLVLGRGGKLYVRLRGRVDHVIIRSYTQALVVMAESIQPCSTDGWVPVDLAPNLLPRKGLSYLAVWAQGQGYRSTRRLVTVFVVQ